MVRVYLIHLLDETFLTSFIRADFFFNLKFTESHENVYVHVIV
jgi:hypothetical protein